MPKLSPTMEEGTIVKWHKKVGEFVEAGDLLIEVATDKATVEFNALDQGWLREIIVQENGEAKVNQPIAVFSEEQNESITTAAPTAPAPAPVKAEVEAPKAAPTMPAQKVVSSSDRVAASPLAKKLAKQREIDLSSVQGTGPNGRVMSRDLPLEGAPVARETTEIPLTPMRKVISKRLQQAKATIPHFYLNQAVNVESLLTLREQLKASNIPVTINDLIVKACALALEKHPVVNCGFNDEKNCILKFGSIDISVAVTVDGGLITPIVKNADVLGIVEISKAIKELSSRAKVGKLQEHEYKGGSFTVSNLGMYGITSFAAIINPPQSAILAVGGVQETPVVRNGQVVPGKVMMLTLSADHRVVDGVAGAEFLVSLKNILENPVVLVI
jgi:pyruvate dehydrogenase E2 component (dihydrolipoamide acetyltransferase)